MRVIAYASRALSPAEKKYHLHAGKLEFLALKWAVTDHFRDYLYYSPKFTVFTDNNPLTYILTSAKLNATGLRWVNELADFHFEIKYRPGKANADADTLSRMPIRFENYMESCSAIYRWKSKTANPGISSSSGSRIVSAILNDTERTQLATKRSQSFDLPWTTPAVGQILVSFNLTKVNSTRAIHSATFSLTLIRLGKKPLFPPGLQHTNKTWSRPKRACPLAPNSWFSHDVTKIRTTKLSIFLRFYLNDV